MPLTPSGPAAQHLTGQDLNQPADLGSSKPSLSLRDARLRDRLAIQELTLEAYREYAAPLGDDWPRYLTNILARLERPAPATQIVAWVSAWWVRCCFTLPEPPL